MATARYDINARIVKLVPKSPKKPGTLAAWKWSLYRNGMTVGQFLAKGGKRSTLRWDMGHGFIRIQ